MTKHEKKRLQGLLVRAINLTYNIECDLDDIVACVDNDNMVEAKEHALRVIRNLEMITVALKKRFVEHT